MIKTRIKVLEEIYDRTLVVIIDSEIQIEYLKKQDPKMIVFQKVEMFGGTPMKKDYTAGMLVVKEEAKLKENNAVLNIISKKIKEEKPEISEKP